MDAPVSELDDSIASMNERLEKSRELLGDDDEEGANGNFDGPVLSFAERQMQKGKGKGRARSLTAQLASFSPRTSVSAPLEGEIVGAAPPVTASLADPTHRPEEQPQHPSDLIPVPLEAGAPEVTSLDALLQQASSLSSLSSSSSLSFSGNPAAARKPPAPRHTPRHILEEILPRHMTREELLSENLDKPELLTMIGLYRELIEALNVDLVGALSEREALTDEQEDLKAVRAKVELRQVEMVERLARGEDGEGPDDSPVDLRGVEEVRLPSASPARAGQPRRRGLSDFFKKKKDTSTQQQQPQGKDEKEKKKGKLALILDALKDRKKEKKKKGSGAASSATVEARDSDAEGYYYSSAEEGGEHPQHHHHPQLGVINYRYH
jgi:hypothetical protein